MKTSYLFLTYFTMLALSAVAQTPAAAPDELSKIREAHVKAAERALAPINAKYRQELEKLKAGYMKAGNLNAANQAEAEIKALEERSAAVANSGKSTPEEKLIGTVWRWWLSETLSFEKDGVVMWNVKGQAPKEWSWKVENLEKRIIAIKSAGGTTLTSSWMRSSRQEISARAVMLERFCGRLRG